MDDRNGWYNALTEIPASESLAYSIEYMLDRANAGGLDLAGFQNGTYGNIAAASLKWDIAWANMSTIIGKPAPYFALGQEIDQKLTSPEIQDAQEKTGLSFSELGLKFPYAIMLMNRGLANAWQLSLTTTTLPTCFK